MNWFVEHATFQNLLLLSNMLGWLIVGLIAVLSWVAPRTETKKDDSVLNWLKWLNSSAPPTFRKVKLLHETGQLPSGVDRYAEYLIRLGEAYQAASGAKEAILPPELEKTAKLIADGMHAENKLQVK